MATNSDLMRERCLYLIEMCHRTERESGQLLPETLADMAIIRFALHKLSLPPAPDTIRDCAKHLADMRLGDWCPAIDANTLSELGRLALIGLDVEDAEWQINEEHRT